MRVAFGKVIITPENYMGIPLAGYTPITKCTGKLDDIYAHAVLIEDVALGNVNHRLLFISLDILKMSLLFGDYVKEQVQKYCHVAPNQILVHATHTHKAPDVTGEFGDLGGYPTVVKKIMCAGNKHDRYIVWITRRIVKLVNELIKNLTPCKIAWAREPIARPDIVINRRHTMRRSRPDVGVIAFRAVGDDHLLGFMMHFACHGTTLANFTTELSADWMGRAVARVGELSDGAIEAAYFSGPSGDLNPITTCGTDFEYLQQHINALVLGQRGTYKSTQRIGNAVGRQALQLAQSIPVEDFFPRITFQTFTKTFWVPMKDYSYFSKTWFQNTIIFLAKRYLLLKVAVTHEEPNFPGLALKHRGSDFSVYSTLSWIRITASSADGVTERELSILTAPGELFEDIGKYLRKRCPTGYKDTFVFQNTNDWMSYLFSKAEYMGQNGYETLPSFSPRAGETYREEMETLFAEVASRVNISYS